VVSEKTGEGVPDRHLDMFRRRLADQQVVLPLHVLEDRLVHLVAGHPHRLALDDPPREMTATSVVPPPMSTIMLPDGSVMGAPAPIAAASGSSMRYTSRAPRLCADSRTARRSTSVQP